MENIQITAPGFHWPKPAAAQDNPSTPATTSPQALRLKAEIAVERLRAYEQAAQARQRCGSWLPGAAHTTRDFESLSAAQDFTGYRRRQ